MNNLYKYSLLNLLLVPCLSQAIGIDAMVKFGEENKTSFTITNSNKERQFMQVLIDKVQINKDGTLNKVRFSRANIADWDLTAKPNKTVIDPGLKRTFQLEFSPSTPADAAKDQAYFVSFMPTPTTNSGERVMLSKMAIGFSALAIFPAKEDKALKYRMSFDKTGLKIKNQGETYIRVAVDGCKAGTPSDKRLACAKEVYALAGRDLPITLPAAVKDNATFKIELSTHRAKFNEKFTITKGKTVTSKAS